MRMTDIPVMPEEHVEHDEKKGYLKTLATIVSRSFVGVLFSESMLVYLLNYTLNLHLLPFD